MREPVVFEFWPGDKVKNRLGETGIVMMSTLELDGPNRFYVSYPGIEKWQWAKELTEVETEE